MIVYELIIYIIVHRRDKVLQIGSYLALEYGSAKFALLGPGSGPWLHFCITCTYTQVLGQLTLNSEWFLIHVLRILISEALHQKEIRPSLVLLGSAAVTS